MMEIVVKRREKGKVEKAKAGEVKKLPFESNLIS